MEEKKPRGAVEKGRKHRWTLANGSLLVMQGSVQRLYTHEIPREAKVKTSRIVRCPAPSPLRRPPLTHLPCPLRAPSPSPFASWYTKAMLLLSHPNTSLGREQHPWPVPGHRNAWRRAPQRLHARLARQNIARQIAPPPHHRWRASEWVCGRGEPAISLWPNRRPHLPPCTPWAAQAGLPTEPMRRSVRRCSNFTRIEPPLFSSRKINARSTGGLLGAMAAFSPLANFFFPHPGWPASARPNLRALSLPHACSPPSPLVPSPPSDRERPEETPVDQQRYHRPSSLHLTTTHLDPLQCERHCAWTQRYALALIPPTPAPTGCSRASPSPSWNGWPASTRWSTALTPTTDTGERREHSGAVISCVH